MRQVLARPSPVKKENSKKNFRRFFIFLIVLIFLFCLFGFLSHLPKIILNEVEVKNTKVLDAEDVKTQTLKYLKGNIALIYAKGNIFLYSEKDISNFIKNTFPRVYEINSISREKQKLSIVIEEREAVFLWCGFNEPKYEEKFSAKDCYFIDQTGFIFDEAPFFTDGVYFTVYGGVNKEEKIIGQTIILQNSMKDLLKVVETLKNSGINVHSMILRDDGQHEFLIDYKTSFGSFAKVLFNEDESFEILIEKIKASLSESEFLTDMELYKQDLEYIDTRFKNRVFYKLINE